MVLTNFPDPCLPIMANNRLFYKNENLFRRNATFDLFNNNNNNNTNNNNNNITNNYNNSVEISGNATNSISSNGYYGYSSVNNFCADTQQQQQKHTEQEQPQTEQQQYQQMSAATSYARHQQDYQQHLIDSTNVQSCSYSYLKNKRQRNSDLNNNKLNNFKRCKLESK